ncbi:MAG: hypothetical protein HC843_12585 [Sphingomonadales bacterium]|nr:hypothetical protein [Sphingomonadales bacterium]
MATLALNAVSVLGGPLGVLPAAALNAVGIPISGGIIGDLLGIGPVSRSEGPRLSDLRVQSSTYGNPIPRVFGPENRLSGNVIWSTGLVETKTTKKQGGKGGGAKTKTTTYSYHVDCAIGLCRGPAIVKRIWADGKLFRDLNSIQKTLLKFASMLAGKTSFPIRQFKPPWALAMFQPIAGFAMSFSTGWNLPNLGTGFRTLPSK